MAYENPNVCKEIYLPIIEEIVDTSCPFDEYKSKTGIDLHEIFSFNDDLELNIKTTAKIFVVIGDVVPITANRIVLLALTEAGTGEYKHEIIDGLYGGHFMILKTDQEYISFVTI